MGDGGLHQALRTLCLNTDWNYAVFWKLKHRARMMLTWEEAYHEQLEKNVPSGSKCAGNMVDNLLDEEYAQDVLGLAVAKMSYHVYSLGEGIVGQVAVTGKHLWVSGDQLASDSCSSVEHSDGWQTQLSAGIRTIAVVAVVPYGVVQLGSVKTIVEDLKLVKHIKDTFFELQSSLIGCVSSGQHCSIECSPCPSDVSTRVSRSGTYHNHVYKQDKTMERNWSSTCSPLLHSRGKPADCSYVLEENGGKTSILPPVSKISHVGQGKQVPQIMADNEKACSGEFSGLVDSSMEAKSRQNYIHTRTNSYTDTVTADNFGINASYSISELLESAQNGESYVPGTSNPQLLKDSEGNTDLQSEINNMETLATSFKFPAGYELYEALGPAFYKQKSNCDWESETAATETVDEMPERTTSSSLLTPNSGTEHLLQAVIANVGHSDYKRSVKSLLPKVKPTEDMQTSHSACCSLEQSFLVKDDMQTNSDAYGSSHGFSSASHSRCSEQLDRQQEPAKAGKKRARPGESGRPRPRDRQLIQDRIKELRELVPNGSKCSIDSLLERTIKHMLFMQCITKHADKIDQCAESKLLCKDSGIKRPSSHEHGSSWAMEVGNQLNACPIVVENLGVSGQMLVEMLCEERIHFLEIAEAIRSLDLTILKGVTEAYGDKTWMCFVVEGQSNRSMHRMDILWSLVQIMQSKTKT